MLCFLQVMTLNQHQLMKVKICMPFDPIISLIEIYPIKNTLTSMQRHITKLLIAILYKYGTLENILNIHKREVFVCLFVFNLI